MRILELGAFLVGAAVAFQVGAVPRSSPSGVESPLPERPFRKMRVDRVTQDKVSRKDPSIDAAPARTQPFVVTFKHAHTRERLPFASVASAEELSRFLRCRATGHQTAIAPELVPIAVSIAQELGADAIEVVSGYRSPKLNEMLRKKGRQVASESQHTHGQALDFKIEGVPAQELTRLAERRHRGGIGTYAQSGFIHIDTGRNRRWRGR